jgi:hypothetical protein
MHRYLDANSHHHQAKLQESIKTIYNRLTPTCDSEFMEEETENLIVTFEKNGCSRREINQQSKKEQARKQRG